MTDRPGLEIPATHDIKLVTWLATAPAKEVGDVAELAMVGVWGTRSQRPPRVTSIEYIVKALRPTCHFGADAPRFNRMRNAMKKKGILPEGFPDVVYVPIDLSGNQ